MTYTLYGIKNCDTVRKARLWLDEHDVDYRFHDFRADGLDGDTVDAWFAAAGWEQVINRRSTSWKAIDAGTRDQMNADIARRCILESPTLVKRPVLQGDETLEFGFKTDRYAAILS